MLLANKHYTPIIGIDIHIILTPPFAIPLPIPHPFIGMVLDLMDYVPVIGSTINVNGSPKGNSGTTGMLGTKMHIPIGGVFAMIPVIGHESINFYGSQKVMAEDALFSPSGYMLMTCNDLGMPLAPPSMYLPTSSTIPISTGKPVMVGGPYVPDLMGALMGALMALGFGAIMKGVGKLGKKALTSLNHKLPATSGLKKKLCKMGFEPVDLVTGRMVYEGEDFNLAGALPITWKRNWYSDSSYQGMLGHGMHSNYDLALHVVQEEDAIAMRLPDGRITSFPWLVAENEEAYNRHEKLTLYCINGNEYKVKNHENQQTYTFTKVAEDLYKLVRLENPEGLAIKFTYNAIGQLESITDTVGRLLNLDLDHAGRITEVTARYEGEIRTLVAYRYNEEGDLTHIINALGKATIMEYKNHLMIKKTDRNGQAFYWEYGGNTTGAKCIKTWGDDNILSGTLEYHKGYNIITDSLGRETVYYFNDDNLCTQVTDPLGNNIYHEYTEFGEFYRDIDEEGNLTGYSYDERGNLTGLHQPDGTVISFLYDEKDRLILSKYPKGGSIIRTFNEQDQLHAVIGLDGGVTSFEYNELGLINEIRDNAGNITQLAYDKDLNLTKMTLPNDAESIWKYDVWGRCLQTKNAENHKQQFFYDALDRIQKIQQADNNVIHLKYNAYDEVIETKDQRNRKINFEYTPIGSLKMREEKGRKVHFKYNTEEQLMSINNEHDEYYLFGRNAKGDIISETGFDGLVRRYDRDRAGKVLRVKRPEDKYTEYEYDLNGRIVRSEHSDGTWETYSYDPDGNLIEAINQHTSVVLERDNIGRIITEIQDKHSVESEYDALGNRTKITSSLGANITINRNKLGQIENVNASVEEKTKPWEAQFKYNSLGMETERILPGEVTNQIHYDFAGRPIQHKVNANGKEMRRRSYAWNVNDRLTKMVNELTNGIVSYGYDEFNNLASARYENKQFDYKLPDEVGNLYRTEGKGDHKYGKGGRLLKANGNKFKYDQEGNLITKVTNKGNWEYEWYGNGMLKSVTNPNNTTTEYEYDALGRRTAKIATRHPELVSRSQKGKQITRFVWDGNVPLHEWKYNLKERPELIVDEYGMLAESKPEPVENLITWVFDEGTFKPAAKITEQDTYSIITDYLGTPVEMYNSKGEKTWEADYDIYGKIRNLAKGSLKDCPFRYQGQYEDVETGLYYNRYRYYDNSSGTYISQDPIGLAGNNENIYAYVKDSNGYVDVFGLSECGYKGVREASQYLKDMGVSRAKRKEILESFEKGTISVQKAGSNEFGIRFFGGNARPMGQFLSDTFGSMTNRANLALPPKWNSMTGIKQWQIKPGTTMIKGKVGPQFGEGSQYIGGANQTFVLEPWKYGTLF